MTGRQGEERSLCGWISTFVVRSELLLSDDRFFHHVLLETDLFVAREHASDLHQSACYKNHKSTDHWFRFAVTTGASCQSSDTRNTRRNPKGDRRKGTGQKIS